MINTKIEIEAIAYKPLRMSSKRTTASLQGKT